MLLLLFLSWCYRGQNGRLVSRIAHVVDLVLGSLLCTGSLPHATIDSYRKVCTARTVLHNHFDYIVVFCCLATSFVSLYEGIYGICLYLCI